MKEYNNLYLEEVYASIVLRSYNINKTGNVRMT
jgi:hypothetical protein